MPAGIATAVAHPNIAFIKYWGNRDVRLRLPANSSLSMNLAALHTRTTVHFEPSLKQDNFELNGKHGAEEQKQRVSNFLNLVRARAGLASMASVVSENDFPAGAGIASSASAFAALALAASAAAGLRLAESELSRLARRGSGSASRSVPNGFVEWTAGDKDEDSFAASIAPAEHWPLVDCIAIVNTDHKATGSSEGHALAASSPLQPARLAGSAQRLEQCRRAVMERDFDALAEVVELECHLMHAVMMTSRPSLIYWAPASIAIMQAVRAWRSAGTAACYTLDAGPNLHVLCLEADAEKVVKNLAAVPGVINVLRSGVGGPARVVEQSA